MGAAEEVSAKLLNVSMGDGYVKVDTLDLNGGLGGGREGMLSMLASSVEMTDGMGVRRDIWQNNK
jgi:hypothetical protein